MGEGQSFSVIGGFEAGPLRSKRNFVSLRRRRSGIPIRGSSAVPTLGVRDSVRTETQNCVSVSVAPLRACPSWMQGPVGRVCYDGTRIAARACAYNPWRRLYLLASRLILDKDTTSFVVRYQA
jgi:hypothetical protein